MSINIQKYIAFVTAVEYGSFTKAAEILNYSQSGISRMINDLESEWGILLLERSKSGVILTSEGLSLMPYIKSICAEHQKLHLHVEALNGIETGIIRIATFSSVATHWLPKIIKAFKIDYPNINYELLLGDYKEIETWILEGRVDCGFLRLPADSELETFFLERDQLLVVLPEGHPCEKKEKFPVEALCDYPFMLLEKGAKAEVSEIFEQYHLTPNVNFTTWDNYAIMSMVESGLGISVLPQLILQRVPYRIQYKELSVPAYRDIGLALKSKEKASLVVKKFLEYLIYRGTSK